MSFISKQVGQKKMGQIFFTATILLFFVASTGYFPTYIIKKMEDSFAPIQVGSFQTKTYPVFVHVLGAGYTSDANLPPNCQLDLITLGRLTEGMRICRLIPESTLVCSGYSSLGLETQASVVRKAAISLGFDSTRIQTLDTPRTTADEANALAKTYGTDAVVIVVTDAIHMPRAIKIFTDAGFNPLAAPTNYIVKNGPTTGYFTWLPSVKNISLTDKVLHEFLGSLKSKLFI